MHFQYILFLPRKNEKPLLYLPDKTSYKLDKVNFSLLVWIAASETTVNLYKLLMHIFKSKVSDSFPFCSPTGKHLRERKTLVVCKKMAEEAGITSRTFLHKFRHTYATLLIQLGTPIESIKELLGHWSVIQTEAYAHNNTDRLLPQVSCLNKLLDKK